MWTCMATTIFLSFRALEAAMSEMSRGDTITTKIGSCRDWVGSVFNLDPDAKSRSRSCWNPDSDFHWFISPIAAWKFCHGSNKSFKVWMSSILLTRRKSSACIEHPRASTYSKSVFMAFKLHVSDIFCKNTWDFHYCEISHLGLFLKGPFMAQW